MPNAAFDTRAQGLLKSLEDSRQLKRFYHLDGPLGPTAQIEGARRGHRPLLEQLPRPGQPSRSRRGRASRA